MRLFWVIVATPFLTFSQSVITATLNYDSLKPINPMVFGFNQDHSTPGSDENWGSRRLGGNRLSVFNWENGASNSGADNVNFNNDNRIPSLVGVAWNDRNEPGEAIRKFHQDNLDEGVESIITFPLLGYVAADKDGSNLTSPPSSRWKAVSYNKPSSYSLAPDLLDDTVYYDEAYNWILNEFGNANSATGIKYISLDNEPGLWSHTHPNIQGGDITLSDYVNSIIAAAKKLKSMDPNVKIIVGEFTGTRIIQFVDASDWSSISTLHSDLPSYILSELKAASISEGVQLVDYISFHFYPQHKVGTDGLYSSTGVKIKDSTSPDDYVRKARLDFTRSLWDESYIEPSWLTNSGAKLNGESHKILKRLDEAIQQYFPEVGIMIGEWDYGNDMDISHGLSTVDALGAFCQYGVQIANRWNTSSGGVGNYTKPAFQLMRNYDGANGAVVENSVFTTFDNPNIASVWAFQSDDESELNLVLINKDLSANNTFKVKTGSGWTVDEIWGFDGSSTIVSNQSLTHNFNGDTLEVIVPALTAVNMKLLANSVSTEVIKYVDLVQQVSENRWVIISNEIAEWQVLNIEGKVVYSGTGKTINLDGFSNGFYFLKTEKGTERLFKN